MNYIDFYNKYGHLYHHVRVSRGKLFNEFIEMPAVFDLIKEFPHVKSVLDVGCGSGIYSKKLFELGYDVTAIDSSENMISIAKKYCGDLSINFINTSFESFEVDRKFDMILGSFLIGYFDNLDYLFEKMADLLADNGIVVVSGVHPIRESSSKDFEDGYFLNNYFSSDNYKTQLIEGVQPLELRKHTISSISRAVYHSNLQIILIDEPVPMLNEKKYSGNRDVEFYSRNPSVIIFILGKKV